MQNPLTQVFHTGCVVQSFKLCGVTSWCSGINPQAVCWLTVLRKSRGHADLGTGLPRRATAAVQAGDRPGFYTKRWMRHDCIVFVL